MKIAELDLEARLGPHARAFVADSGDYLAHALGRSEDKMKQAMKRLAGAEGLTMRKRFLDATAHWEKFLWYRIAHHHFDEHRTVEEALRLAEEELLALDALRQPL